MSKQTFTQKDYDAFKSDPHLAGIFYDDLPDSDLLNKAKKEGIVRIAQDRDVSNRTKNGIIYRVTGRALDPHKLLSDSNPGTIWYFGNDTGKQSGYS